MVFEYIFLCVFKATYNECYKLFADQGSTILLPNSDSSRTTEAESNVTLETPVKRENPVRIYLLVNAIV